MKNSIPLNWSKIIASVKRPIGLLALVVLVMQTILVGLAYRAQGADFTLALVLSFILIFVAILAVVWLSIRGVPKEQIRITEKDLQATPLQNQVQQATYDVFVSSPMAAHQDKNFEIERQHVMKVVWCLRNSCGKHSVFYAGEAIDTRDKFEPETVSVERDVEAIAGSEYFLLILNRKMLSSVIFEAGIALALGRKCVYFVRDRKHLPFLMRYASEVYENVKIYEAHNADGIIRLLRESHVLEWGPLLVDDVKPAGIPPKAKRHGAEKPTSGKRK